jgi:hypothetical protein
VLNGYCKYLKLSNGEEIIVTTDNDCSDFKKEKYLYIVDPVEIKAVSMSKGPMVFETHVMQPWIRLAKESIIQIPTDSIVIAVDVEDDVLTQYAKFLYEQHIKKAPSQNRDEIINDMLQDLEDEHNTDGNDDEEENPTFH